jgi:hypothetical protein
LQIGESENAKKDLNKLNYKETIQDTAKWCNVFIYQLYEEEISDGEKIFVHQNENVLISTLKFF